MNTHPAIELTEADVIDYSELPEIVRLPVKPASECWPPISVLVVEWLTAAAFLAIVVACIVFADAVFNH